MMKKAESPDFKQLMTGFIAGAIITFALVAAFKGVDFSGKGPGQGRVLAQIDGAKLTEGKLRELLGNEMIPIESDQYAAFTRGINRWLREALLEKEAKAQGLSVQDLIFKKIWDYVRVSGGDVTDYYNKNRELYNQPFDKVQDSLFKMLREREYGRVEEKYMDELRQKYHAKVILEKPKNFVEGAVLPPSVPGVAPVAGQVQPTPPSVAAVQPAQPRPPAPPPVPMNPDFKMVPADLTGQPSMGPENAPVLLLEFSDYHCPFCSKVEPTINDLMKNYPDKIRRVWFHNPLAMHPEANQTHAAAECAGEQGKFWEYHGKLFEKVGTFKSDDALIGLAKEMNLKEDQFKSCLTSGKYKAKVAKNLSIGGQLGVRGTPNFFVNGVMVTGAQPYDKFKDAVENALKQGNAAVLPKAPEPAKAVSFDDLKGRPSQGPDNAPVTIVEFSDFHCPFCGKVEASVNDVMKNYSGKVRRIWRHYPLPFHQGADLTAEASECASEQGKFWEYHDKLFEKTGSFKGDDAFIGLAKDLKLDEKKFTDCVKSRKYKDVVQKDSAKGSQVGVNGTPHFFINGKPLSGAQPYASFAQAIDAELAPKKK
jgi:protein-disulfide isomerase